MSIVRFHNEGIIETDAEFIEGYTDALSFLASSESTVSISNPLSHQTNTTQEWTVEAWVKLTSGTPVDSQYLITGLNSNLWITHPSNKLLLYLNGGVNDYYDYGNFNLKDDKWHHVAFVFRNSDGLKEIYIDGNDVSMEGPNHTSIPSGMSSTFSIGTYTNGLIKDIRIWDRVRTRQELIDNMGADLLPQANLVGYWKCNDSYSTTLTDYSGRNNHGIISSTERINTQPLTTEKDLFAIKGEIIEDRKDKVRLSGSIGFTDAQYMQVPSTTLRSVEFWINLDLIQNSAAYLIDARDGSGTGGYIYTGGAGSNWVKMYVNGISTTVNLASIPKGELVHVYIEANVDLTDDVTIFARYSLTECLKGSINSVRFYDKPLTEIEILQGYAKNPTRNGLVGEWLMRDFKEGKAIDSSGKGLDANIINGKTGYSFNSSGDLLLTGSISDKSTNGLHFAGANDRVEFPVGLGYDVGNIDMSICLWVKPETINASEMFLSAGTAVGNRRLYVAVYMGKWDIGIESMGWGTGTTVVSVGEWSHISITFNSATNTATMYVNGEVSVQKSYTDYTLMDNFKLGVYGDLSYDFNGSVTDFSVWSYLKTQEEIKSEMSKKFIGNEANLIGYWPFDDKSGTVVNDKSPNNYHANIYGATRIFE